MKRCTILLFVLSTLFTCVGAESPSSVSALLTAVDAAADKFPDLLARRYSRVDSVRSALLRESRPEQFSVGVRDMLSELETLSYDSLLVECDRFLPKASSMHLDALCQWIAFKKAGAMAMRGAVRESIKSVNDLFEAGIDPNNRHVASETRLRVMYSGFRLTEGLDVGRTYVEGLREAVDSLQALYYEGSPVYLLLSGVRADIDGDLPVAAASYTDVIKSPRAGTFAVSCAAALMGKLCKRAGDDSKALYYFSLGALNDLNNVDPTGESLGCLGLELLQAGDAGRGRLLLLLAFRNALSTGSLPQIVRFSSLMPGEFDNMNEDFSQMSLRSRLVIAALLIVVSVLIFVMLRMRRRLAGAREYGVELERANAVKEEAVCNFLEMSAGFQERLDDFTKLARRKISAGQSDELLTIIKNGDIRENADSLAIKFFDRGFLMIYPHFVENVNMLLEDDNRVVMSNPDQLTTELRVLAFARLGVADTATVARFLGLSLNTIYTYRNKMRSRARSRETFDEDVMKIGTIY